MSVVSVGDGTGSGAMAKVGPTGNVFTEVKNTVETTVTGIVSVTGSVDATVTGDISTVGAALSAYQGSQNCADGTATTVCAARSGRKGLTIQNTHATNSGYFRLDGANPAVTDIRLGPGEKFTANYAVESAVKFLAVGSDIVVAFIEFGT